jgi:hypothetical protein
MATTAADTIATIIPFLKPLASTVITLSRSSPETAAKVNEAMVQVTAGVSALAVSQTATQSKPIVERIEAGACAVLQAAAMAPLPPPYGVILMVASGLLPSLFSTVNTLLATLTTVPAAP